MAKGWKKVEATDTEEPKQSAPPKEKPDTDQETRYYEITLHGKNPDGKNVVYGTEKMWLTKAQAKQHGKHWAAEPFIGKTRSGAKSR